ncbi:cytochrome b6-f complex iron-sulfur subunit [Pseudarcicella hirudinis]|uniref:Cytochrome b6-f complex iron-sulfur subunit n=2 Tax=Pseudarcicella hirudinis TaxID=1079859 RepID=A0A1I5UKE9_9BACT|nr:Rieske (2Fe-2S) protein [Pseudarcicella hirudinis]SFP95086.1 cytochrome b6-f complex iron-sulfur subunit [Pseudarcicella hirudinis]
MKRSEFIRSLGLSSGALMAFYCMGTLTSCTNEDTPLPQTNPNPNPINNGKVDFTLDLTIIANKALTGNGGFIYNGNIIIARSKSGTFVALSKVCTHEGTTVEYKPATDDFYCPNHGSRYDLNGKVTLSPASLPLKMYMTQYTDATKMLRVYES